MKALSIRQPWASKIARGEKTIEVRSWPTSYRGSLLICAGKKPHGSDPAGVAVAVADLVDCRPFVGGDEAAACCGADPGDFAWVLSNVRPIEPVPVKGALGLFFVSVPIVELSASAAVSTAPSLFDALTS